MEPLVSILIPAYNSERWISQTLESAIRQTWAKTEIVVVDDGSTDRTLSIARRFSSDRVCVIPQENQGAASARNTAFAHCQGAYIQWLDSDDVLAPDKITLQMNALREDGDNRTLVSCPFGKFWFRVSKARFCPGPLWRDLSPVEWLLRKMGQNCHMQTATWLVSREISETAGPWDIRLLGDDDGEYFCRVKLASRGIKFVAAAKTYYRMTGRSRLSYIGRSDKKLQAQFTSMQLHVKYLLGLEESMRTRAACVRYLQKYLFDFYPERPDIVADLRNWAKGLGGELALPRSTWKYVWIESLFGWRASKWAQLSLPQLKSIFSRPWDWALYQLETPRSAR